MSNILKIDKVEKYYGSKSSLTKALDNLSFEVDKGEFVAIMGASGSGKTTLLNCISTIDKVTSGHIFVGGEDITKLKGNNLNKFRREKLGFIFQDFNLLNTLTLEEHIVLPLTLDNTKVKEMEEKAYAIAQKLGIAEILNKRTFEISGGQAQRVAIARAMIHEPSLVLADEPTGNLDSKASKDVMEMLSRLNKEEEATMMLVTHEAQAASYCDRVIFIRDGKQYAEIHRGDSQKVFFQKIIDTLSLLGGNDNDFSEVRI